MSEADRSDRLAAGFHRLRSTLSRVQAEAELLEMDGVDVRRLLDSVTDAFRELARVETRLQISEAVGVVVTDWHGADVAVIDDDIRLAELTADRLRQRGVAASWSADLALAQTMPDAVLVVDLGILSAASPADLRELRSRRLIVVSGAQSETMRAMTEELGRPMCLRKPVVMTQLVGEINRLKAGGT